MTSETGTTTGRELRPFMRVRVIAEHSMRCGEIGMVDRILNGGAYSVLVDHEDGQSRVWKPEELEEVSPWAL